jgi:serine/threonine-protein kinase
MPPEQALGPAVDARSDIYALGATAYYLLTGRPPFERKSLAALLAAHAREPAAPPSSMTANIPDDIERIVLRCLEKDRSDRFQTVEELDVALSQCGCAGAWTQCDAERCCSTLPRSSPQVDPVA